MDRSEVEQNVAERFTRIMNATPSRYGFLSDIALATVASSTIFLVGLLVVGRGAQAYRLLGPVALLATVPIGVMLAATFYLRGSRAKVVAWLSSLPFPVENVNGMLVGVCDTVEVFFEPLPACASLPTREALQPQLDAVSEEMVLLGARADERLIEVRLGVIDSKRNPLAAHHRRWARLERLVSEVLVPMHKTLPIAKVRLA